MHTITHSHHSGFGFGVCLCSGQNITEADIDAILDSSAAYDKAGTTVRRASFRASQPHDSHLAMWLMLETSCRLPLGVLQAPQHRHSAYYRFVRPSRSKLEGIQSLPSPSLWSLSLWSLSGLSLSLSGRLSLISVVHLLSCPRMRTSLFFPLLCNVCLIIIIIHESSSSSSFMIIIIIIIIIHHHHHHHHS